MSTRTSLLTLISASAIAVAAFALPAAVSSDATAQPPQLPALQARAEGYTVYAVIDASGDMSEMASRVTVARMAQAGIIPVTTNVVLTELQRTWARPDAARWGALYSELVPHYRAAAESHQNARTAARRQAASR